MSDSNNLSIGEIINCIEDGANEVEDVKEMKLECSIVSSKLDESPLIIISSVSAFKLFKI